MMIDYRTLVVKRDNIIKLDWYQKPMASGRLINYFSQHPKQIVINTATNFIRRVLNISDPIFHAQNKTKIINILKNNSFPPHSINSLIKKQSTYIVPDKNDNKLVYKSMPYVPGFSERFKNSKLYDKEKFCIASKTSNTLSRIRISGHKSDYKCRTNISTQKTALTSHCAQFSHTPNFDNVKILQQENNYNKRFVL